MLGPSSQKNIEGGYVVRRQPPTVFRPGQPLLTLWQTNTPYRKVSRAAVSMHALAARDSPLAQPPRERAGTTLRDLLQRQARERERRPWEVSRKQGPVHLTCTVKSGE